MPVASGAGGLLFVLFAVGGFAVVIAVAAVVLALIQAVLPGGDSEADRLHGEEIARERGEGAEAAAAGAAREEEDPADLRTGPPVG